MDDINIAMLIDADNVSSKYIPGILSELSKFGCTGTGRRTAFIHG